MVGLQKQDFKEDSAQKIRRARNDRSSSGHGKYGDTKEATISALDQRFDEKGRPIDNNINNSSSNKIRRGRKDRGSSISGNDDMGLMTLSVLSNKDKKG